MTRKFQFNNVKCKAALGWYTRFVMVAIELKKEEKVEFT
jgi:hypothetical protein